MTEGNDRRSPGDARRSERRTSGASGGPVTEAVTVPADGGEPWRKTIHLSSAFAAVLAAYLPRPWTLLVLGGAVACALAIERARRTDRTARRRFLALTGPMLRPHERDRITGATWLAIGYFLAVLLFPRPIATTSILYGAIGDPLAGLAGRRWGKPRRQGGKSDAGFTAGFATNLAIGLAMPGIGLTPAIIGGVGASIAEFVRSPVDDNLRMTLGGGAALWAAMGAFGGG